jgi:hypothetical protein
MRIISGGQTGVDRAALDAALKHKIECGGWCPSGRIDEFGEIPAHYPLKEMTDGSFAVRTRQNVKDSDGTALIYSGELRGGTAYTLENCEELSRPHLLIDARKISTEKAAQLINDFVRKKKIETLNVAGPRQSEWPDGYNYVFRALDIFLS